MDWESILVRAQNYKGGAGTVCAIPVIKAVREECGMSLKDAKHEFDAAVDSGVLSQSPEGVVSLGYNHESQPISTVNIMEVGNDEMQYILLSWRDTPTARRTAHDKRDRMREAGKEVFIAYSIGGH